MNIDKIISYEKEKNEIIINDLLSVKIVDERVMIMVDGKKFKQCAYILLSVPMKEANGYFESIDDIAQKYSNENERDKSLIPLETELFAHASNLQAWAENGYDTRLLHSNLSFPLLKKLSELGDPIAKKKFKDELCYRYLSSESVAKYLCSEKFLDVFNNEELWELWNEKKRVDHYFIRRFIVPRPLQALLLIHSYYCKAMRSSRKIKLARKESIKAFKAMITAKKVTLKRC